MNNILLLNGYKCFYTTDSNYKNGCVYEHIIKAEEKLGRKLKKEKLYTIKILID